MYRALEVYSSRDRSGLRPARLGDFFGDGPPDGPPDGPFRFSGPRSAPSPFFSAFGAFLSPIRDISSCLLDCTPPYEMGDREKGV